MTTLTVYPATLDNTTAVETTYQKTLDFTKGDKTQVLSLETLKRTYSENDSFGKPLREMYHYQFFEQVAEMCYKSGLSFEIEEIFAANNRNATQPGVVLLPEAEEKYGEKAVEAYILRRVLGTIKIRDEENEETNTTLALSYHQDGLQAAIGPNVIACRNQCLMYAERTAYTYGKNKLSNEQFFETINTWLLNFSQNRIQDLRIIQRMKEIPCTLEDTQRLIGMLKCIRVAKDSKEKELSLEELGIDTYPLSETQLSKFTEAAMLKHLREGTLTLWDIYNISTELYKAPFMEIPNIIPQNVAMMDFLKHTYELI